MFKNKKVLVLGLGKSGIAASNLLVNLGSEVTISDIKSFKELENEVKNIKNNKIKIALNGHRNSLLKNIDLIVISPGISLDIPIIKKAKEKHIKIISEIELAYIICPTEKIIAISGTNGKTTTVELVSKILKETKYSHTICGNIGIPFSSEVLKLRKNDLVVVEISSFQLETIENFKPAIACLLNITPDHLDRYKKMNNYIKTKSYLFKNQDEQNIAILNFNDTIIQKLKNKIKAKKFYFSNQPFNDEKGGYILQNQLILSFNKKKEIICELDETKLIGMHNLENILTASIIAKILNINLSTVRKVIKNFKGLPHRLEIVRKNHILFVNDSKATNIDAVIKAIGSFSQPLILIMGGLAKGGDFNKLKPFLDKKIKAIVAIGKAKEQIKATFKDNCKVIISNFLEEAVFKAYSLSSCGDCILLSPGCSSFDMFSDYKKRGEMFKKAVSKL